jgi:hypothetical protein
MAGLDSMRRGLWLAPDDGGSPDAGGGGDDGGSQGGGEGGDPEAPESWEAFLEEQPEPVRELYDSHTQGLRSALQSEREQRRDHERQLRELSDQLEEGSEAREALERMQTELERTNQRMAFYEEAPNDLRNPRLAWLAAQESEAFDRRGNPDWDYLREEYPELFRHERRRTPPGNAGSGSGSGTPETFDMNDAIRRAAGRNSL